MNIFTNIPPNFSKCEGNVIHKELVNSETKVVISGDTVCYETYNFAYITKSGKIINETDEFKKGYDYYNEFINNDRYYVDDTLNITLFIILYVYSIFGFVITLLCGNDMNEYFGPDRNNLIRGRNMRINHFKIVSDLYGYDNEQDRKDTYAAIEQFRENDYEHKLKIPKWSYMFDEVDKLYRQIVYERKRKETNITGGKRVGGFID